MVEGIRQALHRVGARIARLAGARTVAGWTAASPSKPSAAPARPDTTGAPSPPSPSPEASSDPLPLHLRIRLDGVNTGSQAYIRLRNWVDNAVNGSPGYDFHAADAAIMYRITRQAKYCTLAVELGEAQVAEAESAIAAGGVPPIAGDSYLEVGPMITDLSLTYETCNASLSASQRQRWAAYAEQAVWNVWNHEDARWGGRSFPWSGWSVDNPGNNYHYSFIEATMSWALASGSPGWLAFLKTDKLPRLVNYYASVPGGGSLEGTGYGTAQKNLFRLYRLWRDSTGRDLSFANPHADNSISYWLHATVPTLDRFAPIGDQSRNSVPELFDYHRHLMLEARNLSFDPARRSAASWWLNHISVGAMTQGANLRYDVLLPAGQGGSPPSELHYDAKGTGHVFARSDWGANAMWLAFVAGPYVESHAHQDQGAFTLFSRGDWLAVTENIWSHSGINQGSEVHNVVRFERSNPATQQCTAPAGDRIVHQCEPSTSSATVTRAADGTLRIAADLTGAYKGNPALNSWRRDLTFANRTLNVLDRFSLGSGTTAFFQVNVPVQPTVSGSTITAGGLRIRVLRPSNPTVTVRNWNSFDGGEFNRGWRVDIGGGTSVYEVVLSEI